MQIFVYPRAFRALPLSRHVVSTEIPEGNAGLVTIQERVDIELRFKTRRFSLPCPLLDRRRPHQELGIQQADQQKRARPLPSLALTRATLEYESMSLQSMTTPLVPRTGNEGRERTMTAETRIRLLASPTYRRRSRRTSSQLDDAEGRLSRGRVKANKQQQVYRK